MATKQPALTAEEKKAAEQQAAEDAAFQSAQRNPAMIQAAGITNGMPAEEQRKRLLKAAGFIVSE